MNRAKAYNETPQCKILGEFVELKETCEPTDIIWENRHISDHTRRLRKFVVLIVMGIMLLLSGVVMTILDGISFRAEMKFP